MEEIRRNELRENAIILNACTRSGSNIVWSLIGSSPDTLMLSREFNDFYWRGRSRQRRGHFIARNFGEQGTRLWISGKRLLKNVDRTIDEALLQNFQNFKGRRVQPDEASWVTFKVMDRDYVFTNVVSEKFARTKQVGLVRNGLALCESHMRRKMSPEWVAHLYNDYGEYILNRVDAGILLVRFEDVLKDPVGQAQRLYKHLDIKAPTSGLLYKPKGYGIGKESAAREFKGEYSVLNDTEIGDVLYSQVDDEAVTRVDPEAREIFLKIAGRTMERLGYNL